MNNPDDKITQLNNISNEEHFSALFLRELKAAFENMGRKTKDVIDENNVGFDVLPKNQKYEQ